VTAERLRADCARCAGLCCVATAIRTEGITLLRIPAIRLWTEPDAVIAEIAAFLGC
jgi:hypothetical protein